MNKTDKIITSATINGKLKLIFKDRTIEGRSDEYFERGFITEISDNNPWEPKTLKQFSIKTYGINGIYLSYIPEYIEFDISLKAKDPISYMFDKVIAEIDLKENWKALKNNATNISSDQNLKKPENVIRHEISNIEILQVIKNKRNSTNFTFQEKNDSGRYFLITNNFTKEEYRYVEHTKSIEGYTYYSTKSFEEIKNFFKGNICEKLNDDKADSINYFSCYGKESCYFIEVTKDKDKYKIRYSWECD